MVNRAYGELKIFAGTSHPDLGKKYVTIWILNLEKLKYLNLVMTIHLFVYWKT